jgi:hypothetical protein
MGRLIPDLEKWPELSGSLNEANRDLLKLLRSLSSEAGQPDSGSAAVLAYYKINREIVELTSRRLRDERSRAHHEKTKTMMRRQRGTKDWQVLLLRIKAYELGIGQPRQSQDQARQLAVQDFKIDEEGRRVIWEESELSQVERRALAILNGAQRVAKKNLLEQRAITLADAVIVERFSAHGKPGRPAGSKIKLARNARDNPRLPSVAEVIATILPTIEQLAGPKASSSPRSTMIKAIASGVQSSTGLICTPDLAASVVRKLRRTSGSSTG